MVQDIASACQAMDICSMLCKTLPASARQAMDICSMLCKTLPVHVKLWILAHKKNLMTKL